MDIELRMRDLNLTSILLVIAFLTSRQYAFGLTCYVCQSTSSSSSCISDPDSSSTCNQKYCTIYRRELAEPAGIVTAFYRACEDSPSYLNTEVSTPFATSYYRACTSDLCNTGDGTEDVVSVSTVVTSDDKIVVPGLGAPSDASSFHVGALFAVFSIIIAFALAMYFE